jgi:hypothetical protein
VAALTVEVQQVQALVAKLGTPVDTSADQSVVDQAQTTVDAATAALTALTAPPAA